MTADAETRDKSGHGTEVSYATAVICWLTGVKLPSVPEDLPSKCISDPYLRGQTAGVQDLTSP